MGEVLSVKTVAYDLGLTTRQLDYAMRSLGHRPGSGNTHEWSTDQLDRLRVAKALLDAVGWPSPGGHSQWTNLVRSVMDGPTPRPGWVRLGPDGQVTYSRGRPDAMVGLWAQVDPTADDQEAAS